MNTIAENVGDKLVYPVKYPHASRLYLLWICFWAITSVQAQQFSVGGFGGYLLPHTPVLENLRSHIYGVDFSLQKDMSHKWWAGHYARPVASYGVSYFDFNNVLAGKAVAAKAKLKIGITQIKKSELNCEIGTGLGYLTEKFDLEKNRRNMAIGSHLNGYMGVAFLLKSPISTKQFVEYGVGVSHFSNAAFKLPNLGYNLPVLMLNIGTDLGKQVPRTQEIQENYTNWNAEMLGVYGRRQSNVAKPYPINIAGLQARVIKLQNPVRGWRAGVDIALDPNYAYFADFTTEQTHISINQKLEAGIAIGYEIAAGRFRAIAEGGLYLIRPNTMKKVPYQRLGFGYNITEKIRLQGMLKMQEGVADYFEMGLGYKIWKK